MPFHSVKKDEQWSRPILWSAQKYTLFIDLLCGLTHRTDLGYEARCRGGMRNNFDNLGIFDARRNLTAFSLFAFIWRAANAAEVEDTAAGNILLIICISAKSWITGFINFGQIIAIFWRASMRLCVFPPIKAHVLTANENSTIFTTSLWTT